MKITIGVRIYPYTKLAEMAVEEGVISKEDNLMFPKFYMVNGLETWLRDTVDRWAKDNPRWMA
jgi:hypothetical protein